LILKGSARLTVAAREMAARLFYTLAQAGKKKRKCPVNDRDGRSTQIVASTELWQAFPEGRREF
jgi:hypothetical protein